MLALNYFAQPHKLIRALTWPHATVAFKIVPRRGADSTLDHLVLIEHRKLNDHPIEVEAPHLASLQRHCEFSTLKQAVLIADITEGLARLRRHFHPRRPSLA